MKTTRTHIIYNHEWVIGCKYLKLRGHGVPWGKAYVDMDVMYVYIKFIFWDTVESFVYLVALKKTGLCWRD